MKIWKLFCTFSREKQIALVVFAFHFLVIFSLSIHHLITWKKPPKTRIAVRTVRPMTARPVQPAAQTTRNAPTKPQVAATAKVQTAKPASPKAQTKTAPQKTAAAKKGPVKAESPKMTAEEETLLREIAESLEILSSESKEVRTSSRISLALPSALPQTVRLEETAETNPSYGEALTAYLQAALDLPEYGEVKARLEIDASGQLMVCDILESRNKKNGDFLKKRLPELAFPCFNDYGITDATLQLTITFKNVETR